MQAYQDYKRSLEFDSKNTNLLRQLGLTEVELRKYEEAIPVFEKLIAIVPKDTTSIVHLANVVIFFPINGRKEFLCNKGFADAYWSRNYYMIGEILL